MVTLGLRKVVAQYEEFRAEAVGKPLTAEQEKRWRNLQAALEAELKAVESSLAHQEDVI